MPETAQKPTVETPSAAPVPRLCLTMNEAAEAVGVSRRGLYNLAERDGLPTVKLGGRRLVRVSDLEAWIAAQPVDPAGRESELPEGADSAND